MVMASKAQGQGVALHAKAGEGLSSDSIARRSSPQTRTSLRPILHQRLHRLHRPPFFFPRAHLPPANPPPAPLSRRSVAHRVGMGICFQSRGTNERTVT
jgi:hypothetical protein